MVIHLPHPQENPQPSAEDALASARALLERAGIAGATVLLEKPANIAGGLAGAVLKACLPKASLNAAIHNAAVQLAAQQGLKVTQTRLTLEETASNELHLGLQTEAKVFGGTLQVGIGGNIRVEAKTHIQFSELKMDAGGGMFAGIAAAMIRPKLVALEAAPLDIEKLVGLPMELSELSCSAEAVTLTGTFTSPTAVSTKI
jgi:hypothetical protein